MLLGGSWMLITKIRSLRGTEGTQAALWHGYNWGDKYPEPPSRPKP